MMESMRNLAKTLMAKVLLGILVLAFGLWGITGVAGSAFESIASLLGFFPKDLVQVGSITIKPEDYTRNMQRQLQIIAQQSGQALTLDDARKMGVNSQVLQAMISQAALSATVKKLGLTTSVQDVQNDLLNDKRFQDKDGKFNAQAFKSALLNAGMSDQQYYAQQLNVKTESAVLNTASDQLAVPKVFTDALNQYQGETRDVKYYDISASEADISKPNDDDLMAQYKKNPSAYTAPEYRTGVVLSADATGLAASQTITEDEISKGWDAHKLEFGTPEKRSIIQLTFKNMDDANKAKARLDAGEDIMKIAGEMGLKESDILQTDKLPQDFLDKTIGDAAFALKEGEVSAPVKGALATALLKAVKVTAANQPSLEQSKPELIKRLQYEKAKANLQEIYNSVEDARAKNQKLEDIAKTNKLNITVLPPVSSAGQSQDGKDLSALIKPEVLKAIFGSDVGVDNDAIQVPDGYAWYDVRSVIPSALKPFDQVKDQVSKDVVAQRLRQAALDKAKALIATLQAGKSIDTAAQEAGASVKTLTTLKRDQQSADFDGSALAAAYSVPDQGFAYTALGDGKSARIIQVIKDTLPPVMAASVELTKAKEATATAFNNDMQSSLVDALKKSVGVKINPDLWSLVNNGTAAAVE